MLNAPVPDKDRRSVGERRVLYIEDNPVNATLMVAMLESLPGLKVSHAARPEQGLVMAQAEPPDLVLVDIQMPGMDGFQVLRHLRASPNTRDTPVIAVTANAMPHDVSRGLDAGFADYLTKPLHLPQLLRSVCRCLGLPQPEGLPEG